MSPKVNEAPKLISAFLALAFAFSLFGAHPAVSTIAQLLTIVCYVLLLIVSIKNSPLWGFKVSLLDIVFFLGILLSVGLGFFGSNPITVAYTTALGIVYFTSKILVWQLDVKRLLHIYLAVMVLFVVLALVLHGEDYIQSLKISIGDRGLVRFRPLGLHPNLVGYISGVAAIGFLWVTVVEARIRVRMFSAFMAMVLVSFIVAASARGALVALGFAAIYYLLFVVIGRSTSLKVFRWIALLSPIMFLGLYVGWDYFFRILELDSKARGFGSGGTGRVELWAQGIDLLKSDTTRVLWGAGFRTSDLGYIGFSVESSYIALMLDFGIYVGGFLSVLALCAPWVTLFQAHKVRLQHYSLVAGVVLVFCLVQSFFNRYLIALGNPVSLLTLILLCYVYERRLVNGDE